MSVSTLSEMYIIKDLYGNCFLHLKFSVYVLHHLAKKDDHYFKLLHSVPVMLCASDDGCN
jgi:hypothetical protein